MPRVVVLIPAYNCADSIGEAVSTSLAQTYRDLEVLLIDDGSSDGTHQAALDAAGDDPRLRIIRQPNAGIANALNAGLAQLSDDTDYVARMDGDDVMFTHRIAAQVEYLDAHPEIAVVSGRVQVGLLGDPIEQDGMVRYVDWLNSHQKPEDFVRSIFVESPLCHPATTIRRTALDSVGGYNDEVWTEDYDLWMRLHLAGHKFASIPDEVIAWRDHPARVTRTDSKCAPDIFYELKAHFLATITDEVRVWNAGRDGKRLARALAQRGVGIRSFIDIDPKKIGGVRRGNVPVVSNESLSGPGDGPLIVVAVGIPRVRPEIRHELNAKGYVEGRDYLFAA